MRGAVGELVCTKPWPGMTRGLRNDPERYLETYWSRWPDVWVHGDWASIEDVDGRVEWFLHGRSDDTIKVAGKRLGPAEVESALVSHPAVVEAAAVGLPDEVKGEQLWAYAVAGPGHRPPTTRCAASSSTSWPTSSARASGPPASGSCAASPRRAAPRWCAGWSGPSPPAPIPGDLSSLEDPGARSTPCGRRADVTLTT